MSGRSVRTGKQQEKKRAQSLSTTLSGPSQVALGKDLFELVEGLRFYPADALAAQAQLRYLVLCDIQKIAVQKARSRCALERFMNLLQPARTQENHLYASERNGHFEVAGILAGRFCSTTCHKEPR